VLVRSWNLYHGNTVPLGRTAHLFEMIALATADVPDLLCVQEVPAWALGRFTIGDVAARPPLGASFGRVVTSLHHGAIRSAVAGQGNAVAVSPTLRVVDHHCFVLNDLGFRRRQARELGLDVATRIAWGRHRRIVQVLRLHTGRQTFVLANTHITSFHGDDRVATAELGRAAELAESAARPGEVVVLAGDFNLRPEAEVFSTLAHIGFSLPGPGIDHVLVRGAAVSPVRVWPAERRRREDGSFLSDHAPVEVEVDLD
jgi:endonuclease/exonuclease/phosphatase family metal-dependent hydrolase